VDDATLTQMLDRQQITDVLMRYCRGIDRCDAELLASVYHPGAYDDHGLFKGDAAEFVTWAIAGLRSLEQTTTHHLSNVLIELDGDVAWVESYFAATHINRRDSDTMASEFHGRYADKFEKRDGVWAIADRRVVMDWAHSRPINFRPNPKHTYGTRDRNDIVYRLRHEHR
jgi:hypothetical protein